MNTTTIQTPLRRRSMLGATALLIGGLSACSVNTGGGDEEAEEAAQDFDFVYDPETSTSTKLLWMDSGDLKAGFIGAVIDAFGKQFPEVATQYDGSGWDQVNQVVPLGIRNGTAPDVFALPQNVPPQTAITEKWVQPLDDVLPDFDTWKAGFPTTALIEGVHVFDGKTYTYPLTSTRRLDITQYVSSAAAEAAGVSVPVETIATWDDLRSLAKEITAAGTPGILTTADNLSAVVRYFASSAGWLGNPVGMDMTTGKHVFSAPEFLQALEFLRTMAEDGSFVPGYLTLKDADARAQFPTGLAGISLNGPWDIPLWTRDFPDFEYSIIPVPSPDGSPYTVPYRETGANATWLYSETPNVEAAVATMEFMGSLEGQRALVELSEGFLTSTIEEANTSADQSLLNEDAAFLLELASTYMRACPQFEIRNPESSAVALALKPVDPGITSIVEGIFTGQVTDPEMALAELDANLDEALEKAFEEAASTGAVVDISEMAFPNWDPTTDYTAEDYEGLGS